MAKQIIEKIEEDFLEANWLLTCWQNCHDISPLKKTVNGHFLFRLQYNCAVFPSNIQDRRCSGQRFFDILILFCGDALFSPSKFSKGRLPKYLIGGWTFWTNRNDPYAGVRTNSKKPPCPCRQFFKLLLLQSPHGFSALAHLYYLVHPTKTAMLRRLKICWRKILSEVDGDNWFWTCSATFLLRTLPPLYDYDVC